MKGHRLNRIQAKKQVEERMEERMEEQAKRARARVVHSWILLLSGLAKMPRARESSSAGIDDSSARPGEEERPRLPGGKFMHSARI